MQKINKTIYKFVIGKIIKLKKHILSELPRKKYKNVFFVTMFLHHLQCFSMIINIVNGYNVKEAFCNHSCCV